MNLVTKLGLVVSVVFGLGARLAIADLPEGHWESQKIDKARSVLITYENWFEEDAVEGRVFHQKAISEVAYPRPEPVKPIPVPVEKWFCFAHDFVDGHAKDDPADESCISRYYRGVGAQCKEDAIEAALKRCRARSKNRSTCNLSVKDNCFSEREVFRKDS